MTAPPDEVGRPTKRRPLRVPGVPGWPAGTCLVQKRLHTRQHPEQSTLAPSSDKGLILSTGGKHHILQKINQREQMALSRQAAPNSGNLLLAVSTDGTVKIGLPPADYKDSFYDRAAVLGKLEEAIRVTCSPEGELFCVRDGDLYRGPLPTESDLDWFSIARRVGKGYWGKVKILFFNQNGEMFCVTNDGEFYKGPQPNNENVPWMYSQATKIGISGWEQCAALCFHPHGSLYIVNKEDKLVTGKPPTTSQNYWDWLKSATVVGLCGWLKLTHFMAFDSDGKLWTVHKNHGKFYRGFIPSDGRYVDNAEQLGYDYNRFHLLSFTKDKTISSIIRLQFLPELGKRDSQSPEMIAVKNFDNRNSSVTLRHNFTFDKTMKVSSSFSHTHGFTVAVGASLKFSAGIPVIAECEAGVTVDVSTTNEWNFTETNETEIKFSSSSPVEVPPGKAIRVEASVIKANLSLPYRAKVKTLFGFEAEIEGVWHGATLYDLMVTQKDF